MDRAMTESEIVREVAEQARDRVVRAAIRELKCLPAELSGDDSGLDNVWEEICVQMQGQQSVEWAAYEITAEQIVSNRLPKLARHERAAMWLQTSNGESWSLDDYDARDRDAVADEADVIDHVMEALLGTACDFTGRRVREYVEKTCQTE